MTILRSKIQYFILVFLSSITLLTCQSNEQMQPSELATKLGYSRQKPLLVGIDADYAPLEYVDMEGTPQGYDIKFTGLLMQRLGIPFTYQPNTWEEIAADVLHGKVDLGMMIYSSYRKDSTNYSRAVFRLYYQVVYPKKNDDERFDFRNLEGKRIAYMKSRPVGEMLSNEKAIKFSITNLDEAMHDLVKGKYDAVICFRYQAKYLIETYGFTNLRTEDLTLTPREYCYVSHNKALIDLINVELDKMEQEGVIHKIYGDSISSFGEFMIPQWVWYLLVALVLAFLLVIIVLQGRYQRRLRKEVERAQRSERLKTVFLGNVSHALRTPLNAVIGFSDVLSQDNGEMSVEDRRQLLQLINENGQHLLHFIEELLELSNIEGKDHLFQRSEVNLRLAMDDYADAIRPMLPEGVTLKVKGQGGRVVVDANLLRYIVTHLLTNAVQHTSEGQIMLAYKSVQHGFYVEVRDTGVGLPEDLKDNLFSLLSEKQTYVQDKAPGLGLSICKAIIERTGGRMGAESPAEGGTVVWFWAPREIRY